MRAKQGKRILTAALCLALLLGCTLPAGAAEAEDRPYPVEGGNIYYSSFALNGQEGLRITGCDPTVTAADIPDEIDGAAVRWISEYALIDCTALTRLTIPAHMTLWGNEFSGCSALTDIEVAEGNPLYCSVDGILFSKDKTALLRYPGGRIGAYEIPAGIVEIGPYAFELCEGLTDVTIPAGVTKIGHAAFNYCSSLTRLFIPEGVTEIDEYTVNECPSLKTIWLPASLREIPTFAITANAGLEAIHVAEDNPSYCSEDGVVFNREKTALLYCPPGVRGAYWIPEGVTEIGAYAFRDCCAVKYVYIPDSLTVIGEGAFDGCTALQEVTIFGALTEIGTYAFYGCDALADVYFRKTQAEWEQIRIHSEGNEPLLTAALHCSSKGPGVGTAYPVTGGNIYYYVRTQGEMPEIRITDCDPEVTAADIPGEIDGVPVTSISSYAFYDCPGLTRVSIPATVAEIESWTFYECSSLTEIEVAVDHPNYCSEDGVVFSRDKTWLYLYPAGRDGAYEVPEGVTAISEDAFGKNSGLTSVRIPSSVTEMEMGYSAWNRWYAFSDCTALTCIEVAEGNQSYCSMDGVVFNKEKTELLRYPSGRAGSYEIPTGVTVIGYAAFEGCTGLKDVSIPAGVANIEDFAFSRCGGLSGLVLPEGVTEIGYDAFYQSNGLERIFIPSSLRSLDEFAFNECLGLLRIDVAAGNETYCSVDGVLFNKAKTALLTYPDGRCGDYKIPAGVTELGWGAFADCAGLTDVTIPAGVSKLEAAVFEGCSGLRSVTIPVSVTAIEDSRTFQGCDWLTDIYYGGTQVQWEQISGREYLPNAEIHYNSADPYQPDIPRPPLISVPVEPDAAADVQFVDVPEEAWYAAAVNALAQGGIMIGKGKDRFDPDGQLTLAELSVIYCRLTGDDWQNRAELAPETHSAHWAKTALERTRLGESLGDDAGDDYKYAGAPAFRGDALTLFGRLAAGRGLPQTGFDLADIPDRAEYTADLAPGEPLLTYMDKGHRFNAGEIDAAYTYGVVIGVDAAHTCRAFGTLTRAQAAQMCYNMGWTTAGCLK